MTIHTQKPEIPLSAATATAKQPTNVNDWFLSQELGRQDVLREDKWMLASAAFDAGIRSGAAANGVTVIGFRCRPMGSTSETEWTHVYHRAPDSFELRECEIQNISIATYEGQPQGVPAAHIESSIVAGSQHAPVPKDYEARVDFLMSIMGAGLQKWESDQEDDRDQLLALADAVAPLFTSCAADSQQAGALQASLGIVDKLFHTAEQPTRDELQSARTKIESSLLALYGTTAPQQQDDSATLGRICELLGIGAAARTPSVILTNISNIQRFSGLLDAVEREFFMVPGEPSDEPEDEGSEPDDVCLLNRWGSNQEQYLGQFRQALPRVCLEMGVVKPPAA